MTGSATPDPVPVSAARPDASMTLLTEVMTRPLDPGYASAARRRAERGAEPGEGARGRSPLALAVLVLVGALLAVAFLQTRGDRPARVNERELLVGQITRLDAAASTLQQRNAAAQLELDAARSRQLEKQSQGGLADEVARLGLVTGAVAAVGSGITVTVDNAPDAGGGGDGTDPRAGATVDDGRVLDQDLQLVVNGLWDSGAEAIAINGQRLTALSAIRSAGEAILVDYRPLSPPYRIVALGDPAGLQTRFSDGPGGRDLQYLKDNFGVRATIASAARLTVPASAGLDIRRARSMTPTGQLGTTGTPTDAATSTSSKRTSTAPSGTLETP